ncbi:hypothetical protein [Pedobacter antarcticus]|uniref:hypothetical protein n=1 Tax=Pedobacter antarcticus TaxID=34086 RepID=UPI00292FCE23|nr:hypothetical protein [Pedobacter antarcticus]
MEANVKDLPVLTSNLKGLLGCYDSIQLRERLIRMYTVYSRYIIRDPDNIPFDADDQLYCLELLIEMFDLNQTNKS